MKKIITKKTHPIFFLLIFLFTISSCKKAYAPAEETVSEDTTAVVADTVMESAPSLPKPLEYFQRLKPTSIVNLSSFLNRNTSLLNCNNKIIKILNTKLLLEEGEYKYFYLNNGNYGIITNKQCTTESGKLIKTEQDPNDNNCKWYEFTCVENGYFQFYIISITKKGMNGNIPINESKLMEHYNDDALDTNWRAIPELKKLLQNPKNTFSDDYSLIVKFFKIKKTGLAPAKLVSSSGSEYKTAIKTLFKN